MLPGLAQIVRGVVFTAFAALPFAGVCWFIFEFGVWVSIVVSVVLGMFIGGGQ